MPAQYVRTFIAALVGTLITRIVGAIPAVADVFAWGDGVFRDMGYPGITVLTVVQSVIVAAVILLYVQLAQWLGDRWPSVEKVMLGSDARPSYEPRYGK